MLTSLKHMAFYPTLQFSASSYRLEEKSPAWACTSYITLAWLPTSAWPPQGLHTCTCHLLQLGDYTRDSSPNHCVLNLLSDPQSLERSRSGY